MPKIHKCVALPVEKTQSTKFSIHFVLDIKCSKPLNRFLAKEINAYYAIITQTPEVDNYPLDIGIYSGKHASLRLPFWVKIKKDVLDARPLVIRSDS